MSNISTGDLLQFATSINTTIREECKAVRTDFREQLVELKAIQQSHEQRADGHARELARLDERTKAAARNAFGNLTVKQKAAIISAALPVAGVVVERACSMAAFLFALLAKGVHP